MQCAHVMLVLGRVLMRRKARQRRVILVHQRPYSVQGVMRIPCSSHSTTVIPSSRYCSSPSSVSCSSQSCESFTPQHASYLYLSLYTPLCTTPTLPSYVYRKPPPRLTTRLPVFIPVSIPLVSKPGLRREKNIERL